MRRRLDKPDNRPRWDDPDLKVWRGDRWISAEFIQQIARQHMTAMPGPPDWRNDPTYHHVGKSAEPMTPTMQICISSTGSSSAGMVYLRFSLR